MSRFSPSETGFEKAKRNGTGLQTKFLGFFSVAAIGTPGKMERAWPNAEVRGSSAVAVFPPQIRHVRYEYFFALSSKGAGDLSVLPSSIDTLVLQMGDPHYHHILIDLRHATIGPLSEVLLVEALSYLRSKGLGRLNKVVLVIDRDD